MYIKCPVQHILLEVTDELIEQVKIRKLIGITKFYWEAKPITDNQVYKLTYNMDGISFWAAYQSNNIWRVRINE